jgi:peptidoglycan hydrolase-like protein with peptidoglycan-binding domain
MQFEISDDAALLFAEELYTNLIGRQDPIDASVAEARKAVYTELDPLEWATPVLFVRDPDVELFRFEVSAAPLPPPEPPGLAEEPAKGPRWVHPITKFASWTQVWPRVLRWVAVLLAVVAVAAAGYGIYRVLADDGDPPPPPVQFPTVDAGSVGAEVTSAQYLLREHDPTNDHVTGVFDEATKEAIRRFEATLPAVPDDGILGPLTWSELVVPIQRGMEGDAVRAIQTLLNSEGAELVIDGRFGPRTHAAIVAFEQNNGFHIDGIVDDDVWKLLVARAAAPAPADG